MCPGRFEDRKSYDVRTRARCQPYREPFAVQLDWLFYGVGISYTIGDVILFEFSVCSLFFSWLWRELKACSAFRVHNEILLRKTITVNKNNCQLQLCLFTINLCGLFYDGIEEDCKQWII